MAVELRPHGSLAHAPHFFVEEAVAKETHLLGAPFLPTATGPLAAVALLPESIAKGSSGKVIAFRTAQLHRESRQ